MKNFKVKIDDEKADFFKELLKNLDFVSFEEVDSFHEPRIYPAADFEIRSPRDPISSSYDKLTRGSEDSQKKNVNDPSIRRKSALDDIRSVISNIDKLRDRSK